MDQDTRDVFNSLKTLLATLTSQFVEFRRETTDAISRMHRELRIQDRMLTELRRERALKYDPTKPLPGTVAETS